VFSFETYVQALAVLMAAAFCTWCVSVRTGNVAIVDSLWSLMFLLAACAYALSAMPIGPRGVLALPLMGAILSPRPLTPLDFAGALLWAAGMIFERGGDAQLARFKADDRNRAQVLSSGFWRLTRHPNYFGDFCIWWGFYGLAAAGGAWWSIVGPFIMSVLLIRVSGVPLLEKGIHKRRPGYAEYIRRTNAFFPWGPKH